MTASVCAVGAVAAMLLLCPYIGRGPYRLDSISNGDGGGDIDVEVADEQGNELEGIEVVVETRLGLSQPVRTDAMGRADISGVEPWLCKLAVGGRVLFDRGYLWGLLAWHSDLGLRIHVTRKAAPGAPDGA